MMNGIDPKDRDLNATLSRLITAYHILHAHHVLDEHGHIAVRNPHDPNSFFTSNLPAILISSAKDINQWNVHDGTLVKHPYGGCSTIVEMPENEEHHIYSSIFKRFPGVHSIIHSHCLSAIVYGLCNSRGSMLQASYQMAGFLGTQSPIFDAAAHYHEFQDSYPRNLLINNAYLGDALARRFSDNHDGRMSDTPDHGAVFLRGHGYVTWAQTVEDVVYRAIHVRRDADVQTTAMNQRDDMDIEVVYLSEREARDCDATINRAFPATWAAWCAQVERSNLYHNQLALYRR